MAVVDSELICISVSYSHVYIVVELILVSYSHVYIVVELILVSYSHVYIVVELILVSYSHVYIVVELILVSYSHVYIVVELILVSCSHTNNLPMGDEDSRRLTELNEVELYGPSISQQHGSRAGHTLRRGLQSTLRRGTHLTKKAKKCTRSWVCVRVLFSSIFIGSLIYFVLNVVLLRNLLAESDVLLDRVSGLEDRLKNITTFQAVVGDFFFPEDSEPPFPTSEPEPFRLILPDLPKSCSEIHEKVPASPSGYYTVQEVNGSAVRVYCDMTRACGGVTGGWTRVASFDFTKEDISCPSGFSRRTDASVPTCGIQSSISECSSVIFDAHAVPYSKICGKVNAYQYSTSDAFFHHGDDADIDSYYVDGVSLTYGSHPRKHIWTFAAGSDAHPYSNCQCSAHSNADIPPPPSFVGSHYFCEVKDSSSSQFDGDNPLWDGQGCQLSSVCCSFNNPPWFYRQLSGPVTADIEMRVCADQSQQDEDIALAMVEIFVHV